MLNLLDGPLQGAGGTGRRRPQRKRPQNAPAKAAEVVPDETLKRPVGIGEAEWSVYLRQMAALAARSSPGTAAQQRAVAPARRPSAVAAELQAKAALAEARALAAAAPNRMSAETAAERVRKGGGLSPGEVAEEFLKRSARKGPAGVATRPAEGAENVASAKPLKQRARRRPRRKGGAEADCGDGVFGDGGDAEDDAWLFGLGLARDGAVKAAAAEAARLEAEREAVERAARAAAEQERAAQEAAEARAKAERLALEEAEAAACAKLAANDAATIHDADTQLFGEDHGIF